MWTPMKLTDAELKDLLMLWVADERELPIDPPSEGFMADLTGMSRYELRRLRDESFERAEVIMRRFTDQREAVRSGTAASYGPARTDSESNSPTENS